MTDPAPTLPAAAAAVLCLVWTATAGGAETFIDPRDPASSRRAPPLPAITDEGRPTAPLMPVLPVVPMPEHVPPADPPKPFEKPWPPDARTLQRLDEPVLPAPPPKPCSVTGGAPCR